ncbi:hypothetical protein JTE90_026083 [Oedothorax gibbosus]|uniref:NADP-dependent oxidoreductase domain-containing protein n=1 Tax=Oedothorax gibbosus TaxID=931172 RepID=A0AAV6UPH4_9ARAC|nr:hypothetical protein JTE90_026083 [Oedothorax gibbosus]
MKYTDFGKTGLRVSKLGFGGAELALCYGTANEDKAVELVIKAIKSGINYIDTAPFYGFGKAEIVVGKALKHIPRHVYYLATKVGRYGPDLETLFDFSAERTLKSVQESFDRLGVDYIDILQVHDIEFAKSTDIIINETLPLLQKLKDMKKIKYIGITGYSLNVLKEVLEKSRVEIDVVLSYCRCTLFDDTLKEFLPVFKARNVAIINAAVLGMGLLTNNGPPAWHPAGSEVKEICKQAAKYCQEQNVNISKLAAYYSFSQPDINIHLIGMECDELLEANLLSLHKELTEHEKNVMEHIINIYFKNISVKHWENKEVTQYWKKIENLRNSEETS